MTDRTAIPPHRNHKVLSALVWAMALSLYAVLFATQVLVLLLSSYTSK